MIPHDPGCGWIYIGEGVCECSAHMECECGECPLNPANEPERLAS